MTLQLTYRYYLSLSKNENNYVKKNYVKIKKTKVKQPKKRKKKTLAEIKSQTINVLDRRDVYCATAPNVKEVCIFNVFAHEILPVDDAVWSRQSFIYEEFKDIFEENKQGSDGKSCTLTHFVAKSLADGVVLHFHEKNHISVFIQQRSISEWYFPKNREMGSLLERQWETLKNHETHGRIVSLDQLGESKSSCWSLRRVL